MRAYLYSHLITKVANEQFPGKDLKLPKSHWVFGHLVLRMKLYDTLDPGPFERTWGYHVAPIIKIEKEDYILDPGVSGSPMKRADWYHLLSKHTSQYSSTKEVGKITGYVTCETNTYAVGHDCMKPPFNPHTKPKDKEYLDSKLDLYLDK